MATVRGVSTAPGLTALTRTPSLIPRSANSLVNASRAALSGPGHRECVARRAGADTADVDHRAPDGGQVRPRRSHHPQRAEHLHLERLDPLVVGE
jgi:hypothetical protein